MWMMGYNDSGDQFNMSTIQDPFNSRKLRPLVPRPAASATNPPCLNPIHGADILALNHHLAAMAEQNKLMREPGVPQQVVVSSRWNPTPEQLQTLEELYRRGTRTPSAEQIQQITSQLRRYGKIEGKNVFYWFQNHKARERQKRRRQIESPPGENKHHDTNNNSNSIPVINGEKREQTLGANGTITVNEIEQTKSWAFPTNSSTLPAEKAILRQGKAVADAECKSDGWLQFDYEEEELLQLQGRNATWQMMHLSCSSSSSPTNLIINSSSGPNTVNSTINTYSTSRTILMQRSEPHQDFINVFSEPYDAENLECSSHTSVDEAQTLQLFPLGSGGHHRMSNGNEEEEGNDDEEEKDQEELPGTAAMSRANIATTPHQFFEFLPLKN